MNRRLTSYYIGIQIAFILISWLSNAATGIYFGNVWTQFLLIESIILITNSCLVYQLLYSSKKNIPRSVISFTLSLTALLFVGRSVSVIWNEFNVFQLPFHLVFLYGFAYSLYLITVIPKVAANKLNLSR